jgi:hypothetical protein
MLGRLPNMDDGGRAVVDMDNEGRVGREGRELPYDDGVDEEGIV